MSENAGLQLRRLLSQGLELELPYYQLPLPSQGRAASVLALFGFSRDHRASLLLTRRTEIVETHKGQIAFPGGSRDPEDRDDTETALRETEEEVGIPRAEIDVIGHLPVLWTRTGFLVTPVLGVLKNPIEDQAFVLNPHEIAEVFWAPLDQLRSPEVYKEDALEFAGARYAIHVYQLGPHRVWGATGSIIKNILDRISSVA